jgi:hypothetical protein
MKRMLVFALLLCSGCASAGGDNLLTDSLFGDVISLFSSHDDSAETVSAARSSVRSIDATSVPPNAKPTPSANP